MCTNEWKYKEVRENRRTPTSSLIIAVMTTDVVMSTNTYAGTYYINISFSWHVQ